MSKQERNTLVRHFNEVLEDLRGTKRLSEILRTKNIRMKKDLGYLTTIRHEDVEAYRRQIGILVRKE